MFGAGVAKALPSAPPAAAEQKDPVAHAAELNDRLDGIAVKLRANEDRRVVEAEQWFEEYLVYTKMSWRGQPFRLVPWQREILRDIIVRAPQMIYVELPRKNGANEFSAALLLWRLCKEAHRLEHGRQVFSAGITVDHSRLVFSAAAEMVSGSPKLQKFVRVLHTPRRIICRDTHSSYLALSPAADSIEGISPDLVVVPELYAWNSKKLQDAFECLNQGARCQSRSTVLMFARAGRSPKENPLAWKYHCMAKAGDQKPSDFIGKIYAADPSDDPADPATWIKANPSMVENGGFLPRNMLQASYDSAVESKYLPSWKSWHLNIWGHEQRKSIAYGSHAQDHVSLNVEVKGLA